MKSIYLYDGSFEHGEGGYPLIKAAGAAFAREAGIDCDVQGAEILRKEKGKPYFKDLPIEFSLSHSGMLWMCMFSNQPCGLDLQEVKDCRFNDIAKRHFTMDEQRYVELWGIEGFFSLWVRREAFGKLIGDGMFGEMPSFVGQKHDLIDEVSFNGKNYYFTDIEISPELKCAVCTEEKLAAEEIEMRVLG